MRGLVDSAIRVNNSLPKVLQDEHGMTHLLWLERTGAGPVASEPETDVIVFPGEATFSKVGPSSTPCPNQCLLCG